VSAIVITHSFYLTPIRNCL